jgi:hypothetical protein
MREGENGADGKRIGPGMVCSEGVLYRRVAVCPETADTHNNSSFRLFASDRRSVLQDTGESRKFASLGPAPHPPRQSSFLSTVRAALCAIGRWAGWPRRWAGGWRM